MYIIRDVCSEKILVLLQDLCIYMVPKEWFLSLVYLNIVLRMDTTFQALNRAHQVGTMFQQDLQIQIQKENILYIL